MSTSVSISIFFWGFTSLAGAYLDMSIDELLFGDIGNMEKLFIFPMDNKTDTKTEQNLISVMKKKNSLYGNISADFMENLEGGDQSMDINDFNAITRSFNVSRRFYQYGNEDPADYYKENITEWSKKKMLVNDGIQILMHARYKIAGALKQREQFQRDKRYRLGYLFNRLRRLMTEQRKVITLARSQYQVKKFESLESTMSLYERVVRLDVDMRDTCALIKRNYARSSKADLIIVEQQRPAPP
ncbi:hypothetical protein evm_007989 [Chilo suppressalis]|nr:hypothetical protein evm_007989 [Chilo suppressalis]